MEDVCLTEPEIAKRFSIKLRRFQRLVREFDAHLARFERSFRLNHHILANAPSAHPFGKRQLLIFLHETGEAYLQDRATHRIVEKLRPTPRLRELFPFLPWPESDIPS